MRNPIFYLLLLVLVVLDGWLLAHPNLVGQAGLFFFDYTEAVETFPKALGTVSLVVVVTLVIAWLIGRLGQAIAILLSVALLAGSAYYLFQSFIQYNSGLYKLSGAGFRAGAILLPGLVVLVFAQATWDAITQKRR